MNNELSQSGDPLKSVTWRGWVAVGLIAGLLGVAFRVPLGWMVDRWTAPESYYSHGFLVPLVALFLVYRDRFRLADGAAGRSWVGLSVMLAGVSLLLLSGRLNVFFTGAFAMVPVVWGLCGFLMGVQVMKRLWFPVFLLLFMVPLPLQVIDDISLEMKLLVGKITLLLIEGVGITAINDGASIYLGDAAVVIGNACSGLRSLISLIFLGVLFAYYGGLTPWRRGVLFLSSIPIAILANVTRVFLLCMLAYAFGNNSIKGVVHDASGYMIFVVAFGLLFGVSKALGRRRHGGDGDSNSTAVQQAPAQT